MWMGVRLVCTVYMYLRSDLAYLRNTMPLLRLQKLLKCRWENEILSFPAMIDRVSQSGNLALRTASSYR